NLPPSSVFRQKLAQLYENIGNQKDAAVEYAALADALVEEGSDEDALSLYQKAVELAPKNLQLHEKLFKFNLLKGNKEEALKEGLFVARNLWRVNKLQEAKEILIKLVEVAPDNLEIRQMLVNISLDLEDNVEAIKQYEFLARYFDKIDDKESLVEIYRKILAIDKNRSDIKAKLDKILSKSSKIAEKRSRKTLVIGIVVLLLVATAGVAFWYYNHLAKVDMRACEAEVEKFSSQPQPPDVDFDALMKQFQLLRQRFDGVCEKYRYAVFADYTEWKHRCEMMLEKGNAIVKEIERKRREEMERKQRVVAELNEKAEKMEKEGEYVKAMDAYKKILALAKEDPQCVHEILKLSLIHI
ncbi:MAG: hypothetical protein N2234_11025, partial [Planctomycetota bacterium]|nr:hypothetical protein [Planctomycetota bacterium]